MKCKREGGFYEDVRIKTDPAREELAEPATKQTNTKFSRVATGEKFEDPPPHLVTLSVL